MYFVFTFCVMVSRYQQIFRETWRIAGGGELAMDQQPTPEGVAIPPNRPILQDLCYSTSCSPVLFFRRKRRSCSSPPAFSRRLLRSFRRDWLSFLLWTNITFLFVPVWSSLLYLLFQGFLLLALAVTILHFVKELESLQRISDTFLTWYALLSLN